MVTDGKAVGEAKPFPKLGYLMFLIRDLLANGGGFTFPPLVEPLLVPFLGANAPIVAQLGGAYTRNPHRNLITRDISDRWRVVAVPAAINIISSPVHFSNHPRFCLLLFADLSGSRSDFVRFISWRWTSTTTQRRPLVSGSARSQHHISARHRHVS